MDVTRRRAIAFDRCFGIFRAGPARRGVVLCPSFGLEALTARRAFADLADRLAARGLPNLVFDWDGTGDSLGSDRDPDRLAAWKRSLAAAVDALRRLADVDEVALVGLRLGATLACEVASERADVAALVALAPVVSGRMYVREQESLARLLRVRKDDEPADSDEDGGFALAGFFTSAATAADLRGVDLRRLARPPAADLLLVARDGDAAVAGLAELWSAAGAGVATAPFECFDAFLSDPTRSVVPDAVWTEVVDHLAAPAAPAATAPAAASPNAVSEREPLPAAASLEAADWREEPVIFGPAPGLYGVLTLPRRPIAGPWVLLLDAGRNPHVGWGRQNVDLARALAADGHAVLRFDQAGIGDSPARPDGPAEVLYSMDAVADVRAAMDLAAGRGATRFALVGGCSGAHLALHTALADDRVSALVPINLQRFVWSDGDSLEAAMRGEFRATSAYAGLIRRADTWRRLATGEIKVAAIALELMRRLATRIAGAVRKAIVTDPARRWLAALDRRGTRVLFVFGSDDGGRDEFAAHVGSEARLPLRCPGARVELIERADHNLGPRDARLRLVELVRGFLAAGR